MKIFLIDILLILIIYTSLILLIFFKNRRARLLLAAAVPVMIFSLPVFSALHGFYLYYGYFFIFTGLFTYPLAVITIITDYYPSDKTKHLLTWATLSAFFTAFSFFNLRINYSLVILYHTAAYLYMFFIIKNRLMMKKNITLIVLISLITVIFNFILLPDMQSLIVSLMALYLFTCFMMLFDYSKRVNLINQKISTLSILNKRYDQLITRQKQNIEQLKRIIEQKDMELLQVARHASLAEITTGIAHELAQPLTGIKCISQSIVDDINYNELDLMQTVSDLTKISSLVDRSSSIIDHIRTFSRKRGFFFQPADLNTCILNAVELVANQLKNSEIDMVFILDDTIPEIYGDNLSLEQLFINMIINSRDAIIKRKEENPEPAGQIKIKTFSGNGNVTLVIEDNGCGIPQDIIPKIWTPFFTTKKKGKGTGIGLSLSHRIIREHNAEVAIDNSGHGTKFTITFPVETADTSQAEEN